MIRIIILLNMLGPKDDLSSYKADNTCDLLYAVIVFRVMKICTRENLDKWLSVLMSSSKQVTLEHHCHCQGEREPWKFPCHLTSMMLQPVTHLTLCIPHVSTRVTGLGVYILVSMHNHHLGMQKCRSLAIVGLHAKYFALKNKPITSSWTSW